MDSNENREVGESFSLNEETGSSDHDEGGASSCVNAAPSGGNALPPEVQLKISQQDEPPDLSKLRSETGVAQQEESVDTEEYQSAEENSNQFSIFSSMSIISGHELPSSVPPDYKERTSPEDERPQPADAHTTDTIRVAGVDDTTNLELLQLYFENLRKSGGDSIHHIADHRGHGFVLVTFKDPAAGKRVLAREHTIDKCHLTVSSYTTLFDSDDGSNSAEPRVLTTVQVTDLPASANNDILRDYFENVRRSSGGPVEDVRQDKKKSVFFITFKNATDAARVASRPHILMDQQIDVQLYKPPETYKNHVLVRNLPEVRTSDELWNFVEAKSKSAVKKLRFADEKKIAVVEFESDIDLKQIQASLTQKPFKGHTVTVEPIPVSSTILVSNLPSHLHISDEMLMNYFENTRRSGGGEVINVELVNDSQSALITFKYSNVTLEVMRREHTIQKCPVDVSIYLECLGPSGGSEEPVTIPSPLTLSAADCQRLSHLQVLPDKMNKITRIVSNVQVEVDRKNRNTTEHFEISREKLLLLKTSSEFQLFAEEYPNVHIATIEDDKLELCGVEEDIRAVKLKLHKLKSTITSLSRQWESDFHRKLLLEHDAARAAVQSACSNDSGDVIEFTSTGLTVHSFDAERAETTLGTADSMMQQRVIKFSDDCRETIMHPEWRELKQSIQAKNAGLMVMQEDRSGLTIVSVSQSIQQDWNTLDTFLRERSVQETTFSVPCVMFGSFRLFLQNQRMDLPLNFDKGNNQITVRGNRTQTTTARKIYTDFRQQLTQKLMIFTHPSMAKFLKTTDWARKQEEIERLQNCLILDPGDLPDNFKVYGNAETIDLSPSQNQMLPDVETDRSLGRRESYSGNDERNTSHPQGAASNPMAIGDQPKVDLPGRPRIILSVMSDITKEKHHVLVNSSNTELNMSKGQVSKAMLDVGGPGIQKELKALYPKGLAIGDLAVSGGGKLMCKKLFHCCLPRVKDKEMMKTAVRTAVIKCLAEADRLKMGSIAFPALGTGNLHYPYELVASTMLTAVIDYGRRRPDTQISDVVFILHRKDTELTQAFDKAQVNCTQGQKQAAASNPMANSDLPGKPRIILSVKSDITKEKHDVLVNSSNTEFNMSIGQVSKAMLDVGGPGIQKELKALYPKGLAIGDLAVSGGGILMCKKLFHCCLPQVKDKEMMKTAVRTAVTKCLAEADRLKMGSIGFPALGTGNLHYPYELVANTMFTAVIDYGRRRPDTQISDVFFILHEKDTELTQAFGKEQVSYTQRKKKAAGVQEGAIPQSAPAFEGVKAYPYFTQTKGRVEKVLVGLTEEAVDEAKKEMLASYTDNIKSVSFEAPNLENWDQMHIETIKTACKAEEVDVTFKFSLGALELHGFRQSLAQIPVDRTLKDAERDYHTKQNAAMLRQVVEWGVIEVARDGEHFKPYDDLNNYEIENAYQNGHRTVVIKDCNNVAYVINFDQMSEKLEFPGPQKEEEPVTVIRKDKIRAYPPEAWSPMNGQDLDVIKLSPSSDEYIGVADDFKKSLDKPRVHIVEIRRIQNLTLHKQYETMKKQMESSMKSAGDKLCERSKLWHGTKEEAVQGIIKYGFNRSYCDLEKSDFGQGAYFAVKAQDACQDKNAKAQPGTRERNMFRCKVLVGKYKKGDKNMRTPPVIAPGQRCHSTVDDESKPTIFVTYSDIQAYPQYLIKFRGN